MSLSHSQPYKHKSQDVVFTSLEDEGVLLHVKTKYYYTTNETGLRIVEILEEGATEADLVAALVQEFEIDEETCRQDVQTTLEHLTAEKLIIT